MVSLVDIVGFFNGNTEGQLGHDTKVDNTFIVITGAIGGANLESKTSLGIGHIRSKTQNAIRDTPCTRGWWRNIRDRPAYRVAGVDIGGGKVSLFDIAGAGSKRLIAIAGDDRRRVKDYDGEIALVAGRTGIPGINNADLHLMSSNIGARGMK